MSRRILSAFAVPAGVALAAAAAGTQLLCQAAEIPKGEEAGTKEAKATKTEWGPSREQKHPATKGKQCNLTGYWKDDLAPRCAWAKSTTRATSLECTTPPCGTPRNASSRPPSSAPSTWMRTGSAPLASPSAASFLTPQLSLWASALLGTMGERSCRPPGCCGRRFTCLPNNWKATRVGCKTFTRMC
ncbi:uncharacterized protein [Nyctibius grandis]|uniref:uncharacterized protein isoform X2 n=1 Tax=Nyctibius grandis TaxID=48427 RepID=UPI0035BC38C4